MLGQHLLLSPEVELCARLLLSSLPRSLVRLYISIYRFSPEVEVLLVITHSSLLQPPQICDRKTIDDSKRI